MEYYKYEWEPFISHIAWGDIYLYLLHGETFIYIYLFTFIAWGDIYLYLFIYIYCMGRHLFIFIYTFILHGETLFHKSLDIWSIIKMNTAHWVISKFLLENDLFLK